MKLTVDDQIVMLHFRHERLCPHTTVALASVCGCISTHQTSVTLHCGACPGWDERNVCRAYDPQFKIALSAGGALCSKRDPYVKRTGRKIALARALLQFHGMEAASRRKIWRAYFLATGESHIAASIAA